MMTNKFKLIIIDDIATIVQGLTHIIPWSEHNIEVIGSATDGMEGWQLIKQYEPDIIITDIRMPIMDGLELTKKISHRCKVILISAYADFEYAQVALRHGAFDFIKKPFSPDEVQSIVLKAVEALRQEKEQLTHYAHLEEKMKLSLPLLRQEYLTLLLHHESNASDTLERLQFLNVQLHTSPYIVLLAQVDQYEQLENQYAMKELELIRFAIQNVLENTLQDQTPFIVFREAMNRFAIIMNPPTAISTIDLAELCCHNVQQYTRYSISIGIGSEVEMINQVKFSYHQALSALSYHFYSGGNAALSYEDVQTNGSSPSLSSIIDVEQLQFALRSGNKEKAIALLKQLYHYLNMSTALPHPQQSRQLYIEISELTFRILQQKDPVHEEDVAQFEQQMQNIRLQQFDSLDQIQSLMLQSLDLYFTWFEEDRTTMTDEIIERAKQYICTHLHLPLTVNSCAAEVHLSGSYFANLFKKATSMSVMQFVTQERIRKAKEWLLEDRPVQDIAHDLGYKERRSFAEVFKRYTGHSPSEFKQLWLNKQ